MNTKYIENILQVTISLQVFDAIQLLKMDDDHKLSAFP